MFSDFNVLRFLKRLAIAFAAVAIALYMAALVLLLVYQRDMLYARYRHPHAPSAIYQVRILTENDGTRIAVWQARPTRADAPVIAFFYGNAGTVSDFAKMGEAFHQAGYGVLLASYRGYPGNTGSPNEAGIMDDARAALASLPAGHGPVILWGLSLGSGVAARMAAEGRGTALILQSPYTAIPDVGAWHYPLFPVRWLMFDRFDTASLFDKIKVPVLIMSGTADPVVPFEMGETLSARFGKQATFVPFPGGSHALPPFEVQAVAAQWLRKTAPPARPPARSK